MSQPEIFLIKIRRQPRRR